MVLLEQSAGFCAQPNKRERATETTGNSEKKQEEKEGNFDNRWNPIVSGTISAGDGATSLRGTPPPPPEKKLSSVQNSRNLRFVKKKATMLFRNVGKQLANEAASRTVRLEFSTSNAQKGLRLKYSEG